MQKQKHQKVKNLNTTKKPIEGKEDRLIKHPSIYVGKSPLDRYGVFTDDVIEKLPSLPAITDPRALSPSSKVTVVPGAVVPVIVGVVILVNEVVVVITGASGAVVSIVIGSSADGTEVLPAASVAVTVNV